jgi:hypothetical protein
VAPQNSPVLLGPGTVSAGNDFRGTFTPDGDTLYYFKNVMEGQEDYRIFRSYRVGDTWSEAFCGYSSNWTISEGA